ncbi:helix-turn-helix transcriptional regulator [Corynebacterium lizhenjunii]|uniref:Helix-turn-helix transcriptional regulator n=1 Tax=Corynebacterium lizhenjunii TaxID=2709394 RepID=A0A7T0KDU5_9CORY|nr:helix-turn-helix transcriptional regulator [Corynebacterium lizhenjunii]QPK78965.1 helix-turn-helix transcriptional regulator [Corynebacterium lizhenjunii]
MNNSKMYVISVAAELSGMHAQTLRTYDRLGLVTPARTSGGGRRYSERDIATLRKIQELSQDEGVNLAGIKAIIQLREQRDQLAAERDALLEEVHQLRRDLAQAAQNAQAARSARGGELVHVPRSTSVVMWKPRRQRER